MKIKVIEYIRVISVSLSFVFDVTVHACGICLNEYVQQIFI